MKNNHVLAQLGYALGTSAILAAAIYFYASNWGGLSRFEKFAPIMIGVIVLYGLSVFWGRKPERQFLSRLSLLACCISFGIGVALIGQTYNSHADSYRLFTVWLIPAILFSILSRWQPFYILSFILANLAYYFYFFPSVGLGGDHPEGYKALLWSGLVVLNGILYFVTRYNKISSSSIQFMSFMAVHAILWKLSNSLEFGIYGWLFNLPLIALLVFSIWVFHQRQERLYLLFTGLWVSAFAVLKYAELAAEYFNDGLFFMLGFVFVGLFIWGNIKFVNYLKKLVPTEDHTEGSEGPEQVDKAGRSEFSRWVIRVLTLSVISIGTIIGTLTLLGFITVVLDIADPQYALTFFGAASVLIMIVARGANSVFRYTLLSMGFLVGIISATLMDSEMTLLLIYLVMAILGFIFNIGTIQRIYFFLIAEIIAVILLFELMDDHVAALSITTAIVLAAALISQYIPTGTLARPLLYAGFPSFLLQFFILTFVTESTIYYMCNALFFLVVTGLVVYTRRHHIPWMFAFSIGFWAAFIVYKYYDTAWKLLHKSMSLAVIGVLILLVTAWYERRVRAIDPELYAEAAEAGVSHLGYRAWLIASVVVLQLVLLGVQIGTSEKLLAEGRTIKLELLPIDPRSMLQGDYVRLRYDIAESPISPDDENNYREKISVALAPDAQGVYRFQSILKPGDSLREGEVRINGRLDYSRIVYGIESFFVPEGTGLEVERTAKFAEVKVAANGDAILVRLLPE
jgi:uncharacterized membrane-anchored protein/uncharacterized membrane protein